MQVINLKLESNMKEEMLEAIYGTVERLEQKNFSVCPNKEVIENVRTRVNIYEDSIRYHNEMIQVVYQP